MIVRAPWSHRMVERLNAHQKDHRLHPYTCPGSVKDEISGAGLVCEDRTLIATPEGWVCRCGRFKQDWAHAYA